MKVGNMEKRRTVFICWSGTRGGQVAKALESAIIDLKSDLEPFCSPGIEKGSVWFNQVRKHLDRASAAIVVLTVESVRSAWVHFEAGAVAAKMLGTGDDEAQPRVFPFLFRMEGQTLSGPLAQFQATAATQDVSAHEKRPGYAHEK
jgi:hypothetical protein